MPLSQVHVKSVRGKGLLFIARRRSYRPKTKVEQQKLNKPEAQAETRKAEEAWDSIVHPSLG